MRALVLVCLLAGCTDSGQALRDDTWIFDPTTNQWAQGPSLPAPVAAHRAVLLDDGSVILVGGVSFAGGDDIVRCDLTANACVPIGRLQIPREHPDSVVLANQHVLVSGTVGHAPELIDPSNGVSIETQYEGMDTARLVRLPPGDALGVGEASAIFHAASETWQATSAPPERPDELLPLNDGNVLFVANDRNALVVFRFNSPLERWDHAATLNRVDWSFTATQLLDDRVLITGTQPSILLDLASGVTETTCDARCARWGHQMTVLLDGRVLVSGGQDGTDDADILIFSPAVKEWTALETPMPWRMYHSATRLSDGRVFVAGGDTGYLDGRAAD
jgi:hypothetical protein